MKLDPKDFKTLDIKVAANKQSLEVRIEALPTGKELVDEQSGARTQNPNYKKWRVSDVSQYLKDLGYRGKCVECTNQTIDNGNDDKLKSVLRYKLTNINTSKDEKTKPATISAKPKTRRKRAASAKKKG